MNTEDRELLELAAKAAGIKHSNWTNRVADYDSHLIGKPALYGRNECECFNALEDDGDALRLAVKLQIQVTPGTYNANEFTAFHAGKGEANEFRSYLQDDFASTRRAIVRAAAEIGRAMS